MAADPPDKWPQIFQISGRRSFTRESLFLSQFTFNINKTKYITSLGISSMCDNVICFDIAHLEDLTVYVNDLQSWLAKYLVADNLTSWIASPDLNWAWHGSAPACLVFLFGLAKAKADH